MVLLAGCGPRAINIEVPDLDDPYGVETGGDTKTGESAPEDMIQTVTAAEEEPVAVGS